MKHIKVTGSQLAGYSIEVDENDVTAQVTGMQLQLGDGGQPVLVLRTTGPAVDIECDAVVEIDDPARDLSAVTEFISQLDAAALEEALAEGDLSETMGSAVLRFLRDQAKTIYGA